MSKSFDQNLSRRERQIMNVLYRLESATVAEIAAELPKAPTDTAIRTHLRILEEKGQVKRRRDGRRHIYRPVTSRKRAARGAINSVLSTFFDGSLGDAVATHLADPNTRIDDDELDRLKQLIDEAQRSAK